jgi:hypothetical protein
MSKIFHDFFNKKRNRILIVEIALLYFINYKRKNEFNEDDEDDESIIKLFENSEMK